MKLSMLAIAIAVACTPACAPESRQAAKPLPPAYMLDADRRPPSPRISVRASRAGRGAYTGRRETRPAPALRNTCQASFYGGAHAGRRTASGEIFDPSELTAAHKTLRFGTRVEVVYGSRRVVVRITDRGPYIAGRCLDLSEAAFARLAPLSRGVLTVKWRMV